MKEILQKINDDVYLFVNEQEKRNANIERLYDEYKQLNFNKLDEIKSKIETGKINNVVFAGMGSSMYALMQLENKCLHCNINVQTYQASKASKYSNVLINENTLLILVSQSGTSPEVLSLQSKIRKNSNVISITNNKESNMKNFEPMFEIHSDQEYYIAHNSYLNTLLVLDWITNYLFNIEVEYEMKDVIKLLDFQDEYIIKNWLTSLPFSNDFDSLDIITEEDSVGTGLNTSLLFREGLGVMSNTFTINEYYHGEHLVNNKNKLTVFLDVLSSEEDKHYMTVIESINNNDYLFVDYSFIYQGDNYEKYLKLKPVIHMAFFNRIVDSIIRQKQNLLPK